MTRPTIADRKSRAPKRTRWRPRRPTWTVATFLRVQLVVALCLVVPLCHARRQAEFVQMVLAAGGAVEFDHQMVGNGLSICFDPSVESPGPRWLRSVVGDEWFRSVCGVDLRMAKLNDELIDELCRHVEVKEISLGASEDHLRAGDVLRRRIGDGTGNGRSVLNWSGP